MVIGMLNERTASVIFIGCSGQDRTNPFVATREDKSAMRPFAKLLCTFVVNVKRADCVDVCLTLCVRHLYWLL